MSEMNKIKATLRGAGFLQGPGAWAIVDGQFGSTGKGLAASVLAECFADKVDLVISNAGPNSGHTSYFEDEKIVLQQLPSFAVWGIKSEEFKGLIYMSGGAILDMERFKQELVSYDINPKRVAIHPSAAVVTPDAKEAEKSLVASVGSTGKGTGAALASKTMREPGSVFSDHMGLEEYGDIGNVVGSDQIDGIGPECTALLEISQGFSLSINASGMFPYTTSRDCTIQQALSDAAIHPHDYRDCVMVVRTFPIRVAGNSGPCYSDQGELQWSDIGQEPEITTVTKKVRRLFTWSEQQFLHAASVNRPGVIFVNFINYLEDMGIDVENWLRTNILEPYFKMFGREPKAILLGRGPKNENVSVWDW